jgi:hypothetical protein
VIYDNEDRKLEIKHEPKPYLSTRRSPCINHIIIHRRFESLLTFIYMRNQSVKHIAVKVAGSEGELIDVTIKPGTTASDVLTQLNLEGYLLSTPNSRQFFGDDEVIYPLIEDGSKLYATTPAEVGGSYKHTKQ